VRRFGPAAPFPAMTFSRASWPGGGMYCAIPSSYRFLSSSRGLDPCGPLFRGEVLVHARGILRKLPERHPRVLLLERVPRSVLVQQVRRYVPFGGVHVPFHPAVPPRLARSRTTTPHTPVVGQNQRIALRIVPFRWNVRRELVEVPFLVLFRTGGPGFLFGGGHSGVHGRGVFRELAEGHAGIDGFELVAHGVLVEEVGGGVAFGRCGVSLGFGFDHFG